MAGPPNRLGAGNSRSDFMHLLEALNSYVALPDPGISAILHDTHKVPVSHSKKSDQSQKWVIFFKQK